jgi:PIN domain nuclease of toxin-antitoxin system
VAFRQSTLTKPARRVIADTRNTVIVSVASAWEIATKTGLGKLPAAMDLVADFIGQMEREDSSCRRLRWNTQFVAAL